MQPSRFILALFFATGVMSTLAFWLQSFQKSIIQKCSEALHTDPCPSSLEETTIRIAALLTLSGPILAFIWAWKYTKPQVD